MRSFLFLLFSLSTYSLLLFQGFRWQSNVLSSSKKSRVQSINYLNCKVIIMNYILQFACFVEYHKHLISISQKNGIMKKKYGLSNRIVVVFDLNWYHFSLIILLCIPWKSDIQSCEISYIKIWKLNKVRVMTKRHKRFVFAKYEKIKRLYCINLWRKNI